VTLTSGARRPLFFWFLIAGCALFALAVVMTVSVSIRHYGPIKAPGWVARPEYSGWFVTAIESGGPADGRLEIGDRLLAINGDERAAVIGTSYWRHVTAGEEYRVDVERNGVRQSVELFLPLGPGRPDFVFALYAIVFFAVGAVLALARPGDHQVRVIALCLTTLGIGTMGPAIGSFRGTLAGAEVIAYFLLNSLSAWTFPLAYHVFCRFPTGQHPGRPWIVLQWVIYALFLFVFWPAWILNYMSIDLGTRITQWLVDHPSLYLTGVSVNARWGWGYLMFCLVMAMVVTARNYRRLDSPDSRRRIRLVVAGMMTALVPFALVTLAYRLTNAIDEELYRRYLGPIAWAPMILIPVSLATAVWRDQLFDIKVLVRSGLQYLFARAALRALFVLPIVLLLISIFRNPNRTVVQILTEGSGWLNVVLIGAIGAALQSRQRLQATLDRQFFREAYEQEQVLGRLIDEVRQRDSIGDVAALVSARVDAVLHPSAVHIFYRADERSNRFDGQSSSGVVTAAQLSAQQSLLRLLDGDKTIRAVPSGVERDIAADELTWLEGLGVRLIVPIAGTRDRLVGVLLLGERRSEEPYSTTDRQLLQSIAAQIGLLYENQHLQERVRRDADVRRDVLARLDERRVTLLKECPACGRCYDSSSQRCEADAAELALTLPIERTLDDKYRLDRRLGHGGFGAVFEARDLRLHRQVAAKVMTGSLFGDRDAVRRFEREARAAARLDHRNITRVHDYGTVGSGGAYLIMELIQGRTWRAALPQPAVIAPDRIADWFAQLLDGVQFAHGLGIVHRDLKPENVMLISRAEAVDVKIMDFGLAKVLDDGTGATETITAAGVTMGTIGYMAPEMLTGGAVDERADLFAIGVMLVETVTGMRPFRGQSSHEVLMAVLNANYHLPGETAEMRALDAIVQQCLARDPRDRYGSATELKNALIPLLTRLPRVERPAATTPDAPTLG
jgi:GAF domain-containing protein